MKPLSIVNNLLPASLVSRILSLYVISLVSFVGTGVLAFYWYQLHQQVEDAQEVAMMVSEVMSSTVADSAVIGDDDTIKRTLQGAVLRSQFKSGAFIMPSGVGHITVANPAPPRHGSPEWLRRYTAAQLFDINRNITVGGIDYGVLRLTISPDEIAGELWNLTVIAFLLGIGSLCLGLILISRPLSRWLRTLSRVNEIESSIRSGTSLEVDIPSRDVPTELRDMFTLLTRTAGSLRSELAQRENALQMLRELVKEMVEESGANPQNKQEADDIEALIRTIGKLVSERDASREALLQAKNAAEDANLAKSRFLATMSHEIRTPMNGILGMAQVLDSNSLGEEQRRNCVQVLLKSSNTLLALLNDILDLSRVEAGRLELHYTSTSPSLLAQECMSMFNDAARSKQLKLRVESNVDAARHFMIDPVRLRQMLSNLISNAVKFTNSGEVSIEVREVQAHAAGSWLEFAVTDTGIGIPLERQHLLFKNFSQLDDSSTRSFGGSGLGLSIVRQFCQLMGGQVGLSSKPDAGSRFWIRIPAKRSTSEISSQLPARQGDVPAATLAGRVLVAEDVTANRIVIEAMLARLGLEVHSVSNGRAAFDTFTQAGHFDCVLMDMRMPEVDGMEATRLIREWESTNARAACPIIAVTANAYEDDRKHCLDIGMNDFIAKPVFAADLEAKLRLWLPSATRATVTDPVPAGSATAVARELDEPRTIQLVQQLLPMLSDRMFDAVQVFSSLQALTRDTTLQASMDSIAHLLNALDFAAAEQALRELAQARGWISETVLPVQPTAST